MTRPEGHTYRFRQRSPLGGLAADLAASLGPDEERGPAVRIAQGVRLMPCDQMYWKDLAWLSYGLSLHAHGLVELVPEGALFEVHGFTYPLADYRPEVAALAVDGWVRTHLGFPASGVRAEFEPGSAEHVFRRPDAAPFAEP